VVKLLDGVGEADDLRHIAQSALNSISGDSAVVALGSELNGRAVVVVAANQGALDAGVHAGDLVKQASQVLGGGGGGKPAMAQGGGPDGEKLEGALELIRSQLSAL